MKGILKAPGLGALSHRETEVLKLAAEGLTDVSICQALNIAPGTLGTYWVRIRHKTSLTTRAELAAAHTRYNCECTLVKTIQIVAERASEYGTTVEPRASEIFHALPIATLVIKTDGTILNSNAQASVLLGRKLTEKSNILAYVSARDVQLFLHSIHRSASNLGESRVSAAIVVSNTVRACNWLVKKLSEDSSLILLLGSEPEHNHAIASLR